VLTFTILQLAGHLESLRAGPVLAPYSAAVPFSISTTQQGCVRVWEESAQDGSPRNVVQHEVALSTGAIAPPSTGDAGLASK
jgi:hypothetical protein